MAGLMSYGVIHVIFLLCCICAAGCSIRKGGLGNPEGVMSPNRTSFNDELDVPEMTKSKLFSLRQYECYDENAFIMFTGSQVHFQALIVSNSS